MTTPEIGCCVANFVHSSRDMDFHKFLNDSGSLDDNVLKVNESLSITVDDRGFDPHNSEVKIYSFLINSIDQDLWRDICQQLCQWSPVYCPRFNDADAATFEANKADFLVKKTTIPTWIPNLINPDP